MAFQTQALQHYYHSAAEYEYACDSVSGTRLQHGDARDVQILVCRRTASSPMTLTTFYTAMITFVAGDQFDFQRCDSA